MSEYLTGCSKCGSKMHTSPWCENEPKPSSLAAMPGSALTDAEKIQKTIELLEYLHAECLVPDMAHDAIGTCRICRLLKELKAPNNRI